MFFHIISGPGALLFDVIDYTSHLNVFEVGSFLKMFKILTIHKYKNILNGKLLILIMKIFFKCHLFNTVFGC